MLVSRNRSLGPALKQQHSVFPSARTENSPITKQTNRYEAEWGSKRHSESDSYVHILLQWLQSSLYDVKLLLGIAVVLHTNPTIHSTVSSEHVITWQINQHSLHSKTQRDGFTSWFQGDLQSETEMKRAQGFSSFSALPALLQAVPAGNQTYQCHLPIRRSHTFPSSGFWKSSKASAGMGGDLGSNFVPGSLSGTFPLRSPACCPRSSWAPSPVGSQGGTVLLLREGTAAPEERQQSTKGRNNFSTGCLEGRICFVNEPDTK